MSIEDNKELARRHLEAWNQGNLFAGGKIVEQWLQEDTMGMLQQLGFMPSQE